MGIATLDPPLVLILIPIQYLTSILDHRLNRSRIPIRSRRDTSLTTILFALQIRVRKTVEMRER